MNLLPRQIRKSLALKLSVGILLLSVLIFVIALGTLFTQSRRIIKEEARERAVTVLNTTSLRLERYLDIVETATNISATLLMEHFEPDSMLACSHRILQLNGDIDGCSISAEPNMFRQYGYHFSAYTIREGDSIASTIEEPYDYFSKEWYKSPIEHEKGCWVDFYFDSDSLELTIDGLLASYGKALYDTDGQLKGVISSDLSLSHLHKVVSAEKPYPNSYFVMTGKKGNLFIHPDTTRLYTETIFDGRNPIDNPEIFALGHEMINGKEGTMYINIDGRPCLVCYHPVRGTQWSLALICPDSDILQAYHRLAYIVVPLLCLGLLLILLVCRHTVTHSIMPLNQLITQAKRITQGHQDLPIRHTERQDAVGQLQNSFAYMQEFLNFHEGSIRWVVEQNQQRNDELEIASNLAEEAIRQKTIFIQNMTHQIRTPLNIIMGFAQVAGEGMWQLPEEERKSIADMMDHNAKTLYRMVLMLYDSSDTGNNLAMEINRQHSTEACNEVVREVIANTVEHFPNLKIGFQTNVSDDFCINTNRPYLMRSLRELLYNAAKYSDGQHISIQVMDTDTVVRFIVEDTGPGIAMENQARMFDAFTKIDDLSEGLGLGLPLTLRHITNLGGTITIDPDYHDGCRFIVEIPIEKNE